MSLVARLIDAGTPSDLVEEVAMLLAEKRVAEKAIAERRERDAERQARKRERDNVTSRDITAQGVTGDPAPLSRPPNENNSNPPTHTPETHTPRARADDFPCPEWADPKVWGDLKRNRKTKRLTNTATAHSQFVSAVEAMADDEWPPGKLLKAIVAKGWGGAHDPREDRKPGSDRTANNPRSIDRRDGVAQALDRRLGLDDPPGPSGRRDAGEGGSYRALPAPRIAAVR